MLNNSGIKIISNNKKAAFNYFLDDFYECGISLTGTEIKSLRRHTASLSDAYAIIRNHEVFVLNMNIPIYEKGTIYNHDPLRTRKLLLHKLEISKLERKIDQKGYSLIPTKIYFKNGLAKLELALARGKKLFDKRETLKENDIKKEIEKKMKVRKI